MDSSQTLTGGVLIIGSLLWQDYLHEPGDNVRKEWRTKHLDEKPGILVHVPIRYGRLSGKGVYTMTFSNSAKRLPGTAWVLPFSQNPISCYKEILREAQELSCAEGMKGRFIKTKENTPWCVLAVMINSKKVQADMKRELITWWNEQIKNDPDYALFDNNNFKLGSEKPCILQNGQLNFPWITAVNAADARDLDNFDFLIATATLPTGKRYPTISKMTANVNADKDRFYFNENHNHRITTMQDKRVLDKIKRSNLSQKK